MAWHNKTAGRLFSWRSMLSLTETGFHWLASLLALWYITACSHSLNIFSLMGINKKIKCSILSKPLITGGKISWGQWAFCSPTAKVSTFGGTLTQLLQTPLSNTTWIQMARALPSPDKFHQRGLDSLSTPSPPILMKQISPQNQLPILNITEARVKDSDADMHILNDRTWLHETQLWHSSHVTGIFIFFKNF